MKHKVMKKEIGILPALFLGALISALLLTVLSFLLALISSRTDDPTSLTGILSMAALFITAAVSGFAISKYKGDGGVSASLLSALLFTLVLLLIGLIVSGGNVSVRSLINYVCYIGISGLTALLGRKKTATYKRRRG